MTQIRAESAWDARAIFAVHAASFPTEGEARLVDLLRGAGALWVSLVAEVGGLVVGHVAFSPVEVEGAQRGGVGLGPVAVLKTHRCQGIADALIRAGLSVCRERGWGFVVVLGDPKYYARFGFLPASRWSLQDTFGGGSAFQALILHDDAIPQGGGVVHYAPPFSTLDDSHT